MSNEKLKLGPIKAPNHNASIALKPDFGEKLASGNTAYGMLPTNDRHVKVLASVLSAEAQTDLERRAKSNGITPEKQLELDLQDIGSW
jgi:hypothetical protein